MNQEYFREAPPILQEFLGYMNNVKGRSPLSVDEYYRDLRTFFRFLLKERRKVSADCEPEQIDISAVDLALLKTVTFTDILLFLNYCQNERHNQADTRARKTTSLKTYFRYLTVKVNKLSHNPTEGLDSPTLPKRVPKYLTLEECLQLLEAVDGEYQARDYCILVFFLNCGMRVSELTGINLSDINSEYALKIRGKGNKERVLYLNDACIEALEGYLAVRPVDGVKDKDALFISSKLCRMSPRGVEYKLEKYLQKIGLDGKGYSPHKLRHTAATLMYQKGGVDVRTLQAILGHSVLSTTQIYTHVADHQVVAGLKANPLSGKRKTARSQKKAAKAAGLDVPSESVALSEADECSETPEDPAATTSAETDIPPVSAAARQEQESVLPTVLDAEKEDPLPVPEVPTPTQTPPKPSSTA